MARRKDQGDPVTPLDLAVNGALRDTLSTRGYGWLSEETADTPGRLGDYRVWIVDPIDGTRELVEGIPEYAVSVGLVVGSQAVAGGVLNPATRELFLGARGIGVTLNGRPVRQSEKGVLSGACVLASRSEFKRGEWNRFSSAPFKTQPMGSVAYKLARVAAGLADATWTLVPKHEWDVAGGVALLLASGGNALLADGSEPRFNQPDPLLPNLIGTCSSLTRPVVEFLRKG